MADTQLAIDRIPDNDSPPLTAHQASYRFGASLCLLAYEISPDRLEPGHSLNFKLYWQTLDFVNEDYTFFLRLTDETGQTRGQLEFDPFDRIYPTPWWWVGQKLVEPHEFLIPTDLPGHDYTVKLGAYDRQVSGKEIIAPLFLMLYQLDEAGMAQWQIEVIPHTTATCLQPK